MPSSPVSSPRDPRVDLLRGLSLLSIFVDHIPKNVLADYTLHNFGFSDAAELFVLLAGFSATHAYNSVFERHGLAVGLRRVFRRCLHIYGVQVLLLLCTLVIVGWAERAIGFQSVVIGPMLRDGWKGALRGVSLRALPAYLDILPLYILLLAAFPLVRFGLARSVPGTLAASALLWGLANLFRWNLPNVVDRADAAHWYFDPFTWQLLFVLGSALAIAVRRGFRLMRAPPPALLLLCWAYALGCLLVLDAWHLWPQPLPGDFYATSPIIGILGNEPKTYVSPWRLADVLAQVYIVLTAPRMLAVARSAALRPVLACGRNSLAVFSLGCVLALAGRLIFRAAGVTVATQLLVNIVGLGALLAAGLALDARRAARAARAPAGLTPDAVRPAG
ncbi:OpgC family protein [Lichenibacterium dinghuense]|uniref:OpgC family protein n=1 Tax=Lichenibacterium dinghuense TaxID=2895977 RepID=UPI001F45BC8D|nr:OpgC domain-containing protein [Lichenibacterium sp. 6Y81]